MKPVIANILFFSRHKTDLMGANRYFSAPVNVNSFELLCDHAAQIETSTVQGRPVLDPFPTQAAAFGIYRRVCFSLFLFGAPISFKHKHMKLHQGFPPGLYDKQIYDLCKQSE